MNGLAIPLVLSVMLSGKGAALAGHRHDQVWARLSPLHPILLHQSKDELGGNLAGHWTVLRVRADIKSVVARLRPTNVSYRYFSYGLGVSCRLRDGRPCYCITATDVKGLPTDIWYPKKRQRT